MIVNTDIDIDIANRDKLLRLIKNTPASIKNDDKFKKHNTGVYFHEVPSNPITGLCTLDYKQAEEIGYFKIDILNVNIYDKIDNQEHMDRVLSKDPVWELLEHQDIVSQLFHIHNHFEIVKKMQPKSLPQLAMVLAIIRPAKRHLIGKDWNTIETSVWQRPTDNQNFFKKAHAYAYAQAIILQMNLLAYPD